MKHKKIISLAMSALFMGSLGIGVFTGGTVTASAATESTLKVAQAQTTTTTTTMTAAITENTKITREEATSIAINAIKKYLDYEIDEKNFQSNCQLMPDYANANAYIWNINWNSYDGAVSSSIDASIDANTGKILSMNKREYNNTTPFQILTPEYTQEQCKKIAEEFIEKIEPGVLKEVKIIENTIDGTYYGMQNGYDFRYIRQVNGIPFENDFVDVQVDSVTGKTLSYSFRWSDKLVFQDANQVVDAKTVLEKFKNNMTFDLSYFSFYNYKPGFESNKPTTKLIYMPTFTSSSAIDAVNGEFISLYPVQEGGKKINLTDKEKQDLLSKYVELTKSNKELDKTKAEQIITAIAKDMYGDDASAEYINYQNNNYDMITNSTWSGQIRTGGDNMTVGMISIDALTGELVNCSMNNMYGAPAEKIVAKLTWEEAYKKSVDFIGTYFKSRLKDIDTEQFYSEGKYIMDGKEITSPYYNFNFCRTVNGIKYGSNMISVTIDVKTGKIASVYSNWDNSIQFPDTGKALSKEEIAKLYFDKVQPALSYTLVNKSTDYSKPDMTLKLVYTMKTQDVSNMYMINYFDAVTGKMLDMYGSEVKDKIDTLGEKIKGTQYEKQIMLLAKQGIIDSNDFTLDKNVTKLDMIKALVAMKGYRYYTPNKQELKFTDVKKDDANYRILQIAVSCNIIKNEAVELKYVKNITREEMYKIIIESTQYAKLANAKDIFTLNFTDSKTISSNCYGSISIAKGLSILDTKDKVFNPKDEVKAEEFAHVLYNSLQHIAVIR